MVSSVRAESTSEKAWSPMRPAFWASSSTAQRQRPNAYPSSGLRASRATLSPAACGPLVGALVPAATSA